MKNNTYLWNLIYKARAERDSAVAAVNIIQEQFEELHSLNEQSKKRYERDISGLKAIIAVQEAQLERDIDLFQCLLKRDEF